MPNFERQYNNKKTSLNFRPNSNGKSRLPPIADDVIQRAIGFEMETGWPVMKNPRAEFDPNEYEQLTHQNCYPVNHSFFKHPAGFKAKTDDGISTYSYDFSVMELETDAFEETPLGFFQMREAIAKSMEFLSQLKKVGLEKGYVDMKEFPDMGGKIVDSDAIVFSASVGAAAKEMEFGVKMQGTAGVDLRQIQRLFEHIGMPQNGEDQGQGDRLRYGRCYLGGLTPELIAKKQLSCTYRHALKALSITLMEMHEEMAGRFRTRADQLLAWQPSRQFENLLLLLIYALISTKKAIKNYAKSAFRLLIRTDFSFIYKLLPDLDRQILEENDLELWDFIFELVMDTLQTKLELPVFEKGVYHDRVKYHRSGIDTFNALTKKDWLSNIPKGVDMLTAKNFPDRSVAGKLESIGGFGSKVDSVGKDRVPAPIFEFRSFPQMSNEDVEAACNNFFIYIMGLNRGEDYCYGEDSSPFLRC
ncbi:hypothetical protein [Aureibacter tunicatorum]|uniref:Uncharacterized protein n=1 Tax=Aureibacter tunicatorum TaxID=866807 RepID=A0AAE3XLS0_9BACT|nr:hypothetical protein [Aureibacter tunicatorum]MDR6238343.1 hypothetical protein [Aureibacter tunicatorum]BDD03375.1 hypothetical protein AUTU_08580 [Aureibacter tunicatorum]